MRKDIWVDDLNFESYQKNEIYFIDDSGKSCCVHSLKDIRKQIFNEVLIIIDKKFNCCGYVEEKFEDIKKYVLDQIEKGEK